MGKVTFGIKTNRESIKRIKQYLYEYCTEKDYGLQMHEERGNLLSDIAVSMDVPDRDVANVLKVFTIWGNYLFPL